MIYCRNSGLCSPPLKSADCFSGFFSWVWFAILLCIFVPVSSPLHCDFFFNRWIARGLFDFMGRDAGTLRCWFRAWLHRCRCPEAVRPVLSRSLHPQGRGPLPEAHAYVVLLRPVQGCSLDSLTGREGGATLRTLQSQAHRRPNAMVQPREEESGWSATERALPQTPCRATPCALTREHSFARAPVTQTCPGPDGLDSSDSRSHRPGGWKQAWLLLRPLSLACGWPSSLCVCS